MLRKYAPALAEIVGIAAIAAAILCDPILGLAVGGATLIGLAQVLEGRDK